MLLILAVVWVSVAILYLMTGLLLKVVARCRSDIRYKKLLKQLKQSDRQTNADLGKSTERSPASRKDEQLAHLVGKSQPFIPQEFHSPPLTSPSEKAVENIPTFAPESPEPSGASEHEVEVEELDVDYSNDMEEVDPEEEEREALLLFDDASATELTPSGGVLVKELARLQGATQKEELEEEEAEAVKATVRALRGTDMLEQLNKNLAHFNETGKAIMKVIREVEEEQLEVEFQQTPMIEERLEEAEERPLSYYL
ncbi:hypothetical protein E4P47_08895 [Porphyromonas levii]|uniref:Uncharacterized protein n=2 Tax=Porphyromonas levii TaxID=28114 RepID=A0A4Y8WMU4_9PORP|nr:hypothetical protein [Porphyromonas levii]TFH94116.1 hypothetical protein E4P47_08895 [Porphyromonas levii]